MMINCQHCGKTIERPSNFCPFCGRFIGQFSELPFEETNLTFLRADISGFTSMCEAMQAEEVMSFLNNVFGIFSAIVTSYKGSVYQIIGDEMVCVFGLTKGSGFAPHMAVLSGEEMIVKLQECARKGVRTSIGLKIGCEMDKVYVHSVKESMQSSYIVTEGFSRAQILQKNADDNSIYVGANLYAVTKSVFAYHEIGELIKDNLTVMAYEYKVDLK
jgi:class 3 adenylate cyclase